MRRSPRVLLAWSAAIVVALTTAVSSVAISRPCISGRRRSDLPRSVVVAVHDLELGQRVTAADVRTETCDAKQIPHEAFADALRTIGRVVVVPVLQDAIVFTRHLAAADRTGLDAVIPVGFRAVHVVPKDEFRPPLGAIVDVLAAFDPTVVAVKGAGDAAVVVASGARVIAADGSRDDRDSNDATAGVTLLVTETEARVIAFATASADLTLAIAPPESACCGRSGP